MLSWADKTIFKFILNEINIKFPNKRKPKYTNEYYLRKILMVNKTGMAWRDCNDTNIFNHYSTIFKKFKLWSDSNIFNIIWDKLLKKYKRKRLNKLTKSTILNVFIDTSSIRNVNGKEMIGRNYADKHRYATKISIVCP